MFSYAVTIGRTYKGKPMSDDHWSMFEGHITALLASYSKTWMAGTDVVEVHRGKGVWEGQEEDSTKVTLLSEVSLGENALMDLRKGLAYYAAGYHQDAITLTIGESELIIPTPAYQCHANHTEDCGI